MFYRLLYFDFLASGREFNFHASQAAILFLAMRHHIFFAAILVASTACGTVETASGGTTGGGTSGGGSGPMANGTYTANFTLDSAYTTCSSCQYSFANNFGFQYVAGNNSYNVTDGAGTFNIGISNGNQLDIQFSSTSYTNTDGCPGSTNPQMLLTLSSHSFLGAQQTAYNVQACNTYPALSCTCAYDVLSSQ